MTAGMSRAPSWKMSRGCCPGWAGSTGWILLAACPAQDPYPVGRASSPPGSLLAQPGSSQGPTGRRLGDPLGSGSDVERDQDSRDRQREHRMRSRDPGPALAAGRDTTMLGYREGSKPYAHDRSGKQATCRVTVSVAAAPRAPGTEAVAPCAQAPCGRPGPPGRRPAISAATEPRHAERPIRAPQQMIAKEPLGAHSGGSARVLLRLLSYPA